MFKRVLQSLSKSLGGGKPTPEAPPVPVKAPAVTRAAPAKQPTVAAITPPVKSIQSPDDLCGITSSMSKAEISARLKLLYRRYNRGASSLNAKVRVEADSMLDAIVAVREKHFGEI
jgi:hypothetical protein